MLLYHFFWLHHKSHRRKSVSPYFFVSVFWGLRSLQQCVVKENYSPYHDPESLFFLRLTKKKGTKSAAPLTPCIGSYSRNDLIYNNELEDISTKSKFLPLALSGELGSTIHRLSTQRCASYEEINNSWLGFGIKKAVGSWVSSIAPCIGVATDLSVNGSL